MFLQKPPSGGFCFVRYTNSMTLYVVLAGIFGLIVGSFLNVVVLRLRTGRGLHGRSSCGSCGKVLHWFELIPVVSFLIQKGRCRSCRVRISYQYPIVEFVTGILFGLSAWKALTLGILVPLHTLHLVVMMGLLVVLVVYDIRHTIIPDSFVYAFAGVALLYAFAPYAIVTQSPVWYPFASGLLTALPFAFLWLISGGRWMGFGDAKLSLGIGFALGMLGGLSAIVWAFWVGAVISLLLMVVSKSRLRHGGMHLTMKSEVPFAPFLVVGFLIVLFGSVDLLTLISFLSSLS